MSNIIYTVLYYLPYIAVGVIVHLLTKAQCNKEIQKATLEAYYKGKEDGELQALKDHIDKVNGNQD